MRARGGGAVWKVSTSASPKWIYGEDKLRPLFFIKNWYNSNIMDI